MPRHRTILVIGASGKVLHQAKALGLRVVYVQKKEQPPSTALAHADHAVFTDYEDPAFLRVARGLHEAFRFAHVVSLTESGLLPAARLQEAFGMPGNPVSTVRLLRDKWAMRQRLNALGISPVQARVGQTEADLVAFARDCGMPLIVKPVDGVGSFGVLKIERSADLPLRWRQIQQLGLARFLMEEYLEGREISVEAFSFDGRHVVLGVVDKTTLPNFVEVRHVVPARLDDAARAGVVSTVGAFLEAVGMRDGPSHTEVKLTANGPRIVESHNRVGGGRITKLLEIAYGVDVVSLSYAWPLGLAPPLSRPPAPSAGAATRFFVFQPGRVRRVSGLGGLRRHPAVVELELNVRAGDRLVPVCRSEDRPGYVVVRGAGAHEAAATSEQLVQRVRVVTA